VYAVSPAVSVPFLGDEIPKPLDIAQNHQAPLDDFARAVVTATRRPGLVVQITVEGGSARHRVNVPRPARLGSGQARAQAVLEALRPLVRNRLRDAGLPQDCVRWQVTSRGADTPALGEEFLNGEAGNRTVVVWASALTGTALVDDPADRLDHHHSRWLYTDDGEVHALGGLRADEETAPERRTVMVRDRADLRALHRSDSLAGSLTSGGLLPSQWATARRATEPVPVHDRRGIHLFDVRRMTVADGNRTTVAEGNRTTLVTEITVPIHPVVPIGSEQPMVLTREVLHRLLYAVDRYLNHQHRLPDGSQLHVRLEFGSRGAGIGLRPGVASPTGTVWELSRSTTDEDLARNVEQLLWQALPSRDRNEVSSLARSDATRYWSDGRRVIDADGQRVTLPAAWHDTDVHRLAGTLPAPTTDRPRAHQADSPAQPQQVLSSRQHRMDISALPDGLIRLLRHRPAESLSVEFEHALRLDWASHLHGDLRLRRGAQLTDEQLAAFDRQLAEFDRVETFSTRLYGGLMGAQEDPRFLSAVLRNS
jgi:hypothetical protein